MTTTAKRVVSFQAAALKEEGVRIIQGAE